MDHPYFASDGARTSPTVQPLLAPYTVPSNESPIEVNEEPKIAATGPWLGSANVGRRRQLRCLGSAGSGWLLRLGESDGRGQHRGAGERGPPRSFGRLASPNSDHSLGGQVHNHAVDGELVPQCLRLERIAPKNDHFAGVQAADLLG